MLIVIAVFALLFCTKLLVTAVVVHGGHLAAAILIASCIMAAHKFSD